ncbi:VOC family protein [Actinomadura oligospora]|uniref:VOC family protein n=1 Tax=Actinomadura oligospora TaxID=111804 RepID=UPI0004787CDD|nr:VOC family protein [Actinomadura oligospora]
MTIRLNHTIVPAADNEAAARYLADVLGLEYGGLHPVARHFAQLRINDELTLDYVTAPDAPGHHLAFDVDSATFDAAVAHLRAHDLPHGDGPGSHTNGQVDEHHPVGGRGVYFADPSGNLYELIASA